jgi:hypothetical protein
MSIIEILKKHDFILEKRQIINIWYNYKYFGVKIEYNNKIIKIYNKEFNINDFERVIIIYKTMLDFIIYLNNTYLNNKDYKNISFKHICISEDFDSDNWYYHNYKYVINFDINGINIYKRIKKYKYNLIENINYELIINNDINLIFNKIYLNLNNLI